MDRNCRVFKTVSKVKITNNVVYSFLQGNELNIVFPFVILMSQNHIQRNKLRHGIWSNFMVLTANTNNF